jgi:hypothetical protein
MNAHHSITANMFEEDVNNPLRGEVERQPTKKKSNPLGNPIINFFDAKKYF